MKCWSEICIERDGRNIMVPCGKCYACRLKNRMDWTYRLHKELMNSVSAYFVTLTYSPENLPYNVDTKTGEMIPVLRKVDVQTFIKNLRYYSKLRYYCVGEYGEEFNRPHYHLLIFNCSREGILRVESIWKKGNIHIGRVQTASIHYITKDMMKTKTKLERGGVEGFRIMSTKPAIGGQKRFIDSLMNNKLDDDFTVWLNGYKLAMPRYYRERVFSVKQKEKHAEKMAINADEEFNKWLLDAVGRRKMRQPFRYLSKQRQMLLEQEEKLLKVRKL